MVQAQECPLFRITDLTWDDDLHMSDHPVPRWWAAAFYATILFAITYWFIYPSWPLAGRIWPGLARVNFSNSAGQLESWHWNSRAALLRDIELTARQQQRYVDRLDQLPFEQLGQNQELSRFLISAGSVLFSDNCAACHPMIRAMQQIRVLSDNCPACHQRGVVRTASAVRVSEDQWLYGGSFKSIQASISQGRHGYMPPYGDVLGPEQRDSLAMYVLSLSGYQSDSARVLQGNALFHSHEAACYYCHGNDGRGRQDIGSSNLTDASWLWAGVPVQPDLTGKVKAISLVINEGLSRGVMPAWQGRLTARQIKVLTYYVHEQGGGQ